MASNGEVDFEDWLCTKLRALNTDHDVFSSYIRSILEGDDTNEEKLEALEGILIEITADGSILEISREILDKWDTKAQNNKAVTQLDIDAQLATIMEKQAQSVVVEPKKRTDIDNSHRAAILAQYSEVSDHENDDDDDIESCEAGSSVAVSTSLFPKNTNADDVMKAERDRRDKAKVENEKKKAQDKANKEKQRQQQQERKEKEKKRTQKGERKR